MSNRYWISVGAVAIAAALAGVYVARTLNQPAVPSLEAGTSLPTPRVLAPFNLLDTQGAPASPETLRGHPTLVFFGFTHCPDVCPTTLGVLARTRKELGADAEGVQVVYVTVDPARDDAARMREYLAKFDPTFLGATGAEEALVAVRKEYGIAAEKTTAGGVPGVAHSSFTYLIDRAGTLRALMPYGHPADDYVHDVRILLKQ
jgi:protein SCO1/2